MRQRQVCASCRLAMLLFGHLLKSQGCAGLPGIFPCGRAQNLARGSESMLIGQFQDRPAWHAPGSQVFYTIERIEPDAETVRFDPVHVALAGNAAFHLYLPLVLQS